MSAGDDEDGGTVLQVNRRMLLQQRRTDIRFVVKYADDKERSIGCHQYVLCSRSRVFETMVHGSFPLSEDELSNGVRIDDIPFDVFEMFLHFVYFERLDLSPSNVVPLLYTAKKYMVRSLERHCSTYLQTLTKTENACLILDHSLLYDQTELVQTAIKLVQMNTFEALESETFLNVRSVCLCHLLSIESLSCTENDVFVACVRWAEFQSAREGKNSSPQKRVQALLKEPLKLIHFGSFSLEELRTDVCNSGVLSSAAFKRLCECVTSKKPDPEGEFNTTSRAKYCGQPIRFLFQCTYGQMQRQALKSMQISFKPNLPIQIKRLLLDLKDYRRSDFNLTITAGEKVHRPEVQTNGDFIIELADNMRVEAHTEVRMELFVWSSLPITLTVQSNLWAATEVKHLDSALRLDITEASRGAGAVFRAIDVLPLGL